jgi:hemolysin activation/secretion protein
MNLIKSKLTSGCLLIFSAGVRRFAILWLVSACCWAAGLRLAAAETTAEAADGAAGDAPRRFNVTAYEVAGSTLFSTNELTPLFAKYTGTNAGIEDVVKAAADLHLEFYKRGYPLMSVAIAQDRITNGIVTLNVFQTAIPQVVVSGECYLRITNPPAAPANPAEMALARATLFQRMAEAKAEEQMAELKASDTRIHVVSTNAGPRFAVNKYLIAGNSALPPPAIGAVLTNIDGAFGTNVSLDGIRMAVSELQKAYRERGFVTVAVGLPQQKLTNAVVKLQVTEGRLATIKVTGNHYFSSNNVMRSLPSLHTNMLLNGPVFQAELNRANANQDRQIYPVIGPGPDPGTSDLTLKIKDQFPLHGKVEYNNQSSPGTPDLRLNTSLVYNNLWDYEHAIGGQYGFSPETYKTGSQWNDFDKPLVVNYGGFYRLPLGSPAIEEVIASNPGSFGYDEATRKFNLPPPSGQSELNVYASRSTIDTGVDTISSSVLYAVPGVRTITQKNVQQDLTVNNDVGARLSTPLVNSGNFHSDLSGGFDYKTFLTTSYKTNIFQFAEITVNAAGVPNPPVYSTVVSPVPVTDRSLDYVPLSLAYNASWRTPNTTLSWGLGLSVNAWYSGSRTNLHNVAGSTNSTGHWVTLNPSLSWQFPIYTNWLTTLRADGQWASEPLISNEQFSMGGINSVRGYQEGEAFGDTGWHLTLEQQTPPHTVGIVYRQTPMVIRGIAYMDYAQAYLLDPQGRPDSVALWGTGFGFAASIGSFWESRFLFSVPLLNTSNTKINQPYFNFALTLKF